MVQKEKVNYQEVYDLYQLCSETKDFREFCADYGVNYDKFMNWQRHQLWNEILGKTVHVEQPKVAKVQIIGKSCNYLFNGNVDLRKGIFRLCDSIREEMLLDPSDDICSYLETGRSSGYFITNVFFMCFTRTVSPPPVL